MRASSSGCGYKSVGSRGAADNLIGPMPLIISLSTGRAKSLRYLTQIRA
jgi:hypothetical protein